MKPSFEESNNSELSSKNEVISPAFEHFYSRLTEFPKILEKALVIDQALLIYFIEIQTSADLLLQELNQQKELWLQDVDSYLLPTAKVTIEELMKDISRLKTNLEETLQDLEKIAKKDWIEHAKNWVHLHTKWQNKKEIMKEILNRLADHHSQLIDRDIKVIHDYQNQSLAHLAKDSEEFKNVEDRLQIATAEALRNLMKLKEDAKQFSLNDTSEWIYNLQEQRETYFDQVLMKIDSIVKDVVRMEEVNHNQELYAELEGEIAFMEKELHHINEVIPKLDLNDKKDVNFIEVRLTGLKEHLDQWDSSYLPKLVKQKIDKLHNMIAVSTFRIKGI